MTHPFFSLHRQRMVRVAGATPPATVGDAAANARAAVALARTADAEGCDVVVFPELNLTGYAIDDLHLQSAQQRATLDAIRTVRDARRLSVRIAEDVDAELPALISTDSVSAFRAVRAKAQIEGETVRLTPEVADALKLGDGEVARVKT